MSDASPQAPSAIRFGTFELDVHSGELRKAGVRVALPEQSFQALMLLLQRPGNLVTRDRLRQRLWPNGTFVDFDHGLNAVINRLREALGDSADSPRFIQTVPRRGYRFIAPVSGAIGQAVEAPLPREVGEREVHERSRWPLLLVGRVTALALGFAVLLVASTLLLSRKPGSGSSAKPRVVPLTRLAGSEAWPAFAPDGEQVAFAWSGERYDNSDIYVTLVGSTGVRRLTTNPADDYAPSWSPDGRQIAFLRRVGAAARIQVVSALGGPDQKVSDFPVGATAPNSLTSVQISWSPDGRYVAAGLAPRSRSSEPGIYLIAIDGGDARAITRPERPTFHFSPVFSPDGHHLVFASCNSTGLTSGWLLPQKCSVAMVDIDESLRVTGPPRTLAAQVVYPSGMAWSPDGRSIVFVGESGGSAKLLRVSVDGRHDAEPIELAGSHAAHPAAPPARDRLVFSRYDWEAHLYRFAPGHPLERFAPSSSFELDPHFSPDGRQIAFASGRSGEVAIWVAAADGSEARQLTSHRWVWQGSPNWSPDGRTIAFDAFDPDNHVHVWTIPAEGGTPRRITGPTGDQARPTWSRDGRWIYFSEAREGGRDIWRVPATGGPAERITRDGSGYLAYETADGVNILYQPRYGDSPVLIAPLDGAGPARRIIDCARAASFVPAGNAIVYAGCEPGTTPSLRSLDTVTGRDRVLGTLEHFPSDPLGVGLAVSQDRKTILFSGLMRRGADLMLIEDLR